MREGGRGATKGGPLLCFCAYFTLKYASEGLLYVQIVVRLGSLQFSSCSILSLWTAIKGCLFKFGLFTFGRALSSQPTPFQVLKIKTIKTTNSENKDESTQLSLSCK